MTDIVERLRTLALDYRADDEIKEAADEIDRLRGLLNDAASAFKRYAFHDIDCNCSVESAPCDCGYHEVSRQLANRIDAALAADQPVVGATAPTDPDTESVETQRLSAANRVASGIADKPAAECPERATVADGRQEP